MPAPESGPVSVVIPATVPPAQVTISPRPYPCRADYLVLLSLATAMLGSTLGITILAILERPVAPSLIAIAAGSLSALVSLLPGPRR